MTTYLSLDPAGYKYQEEPGFAVRWTGRELYEQFLSLDDEGKEADYGFWVPPGLDIVMTRPLQLQRDWERDLQMPLYTMKQADWQWAFPVTPADVAMNAKPGEDVTPEETWVSVTKVPDEFSGTALPTVDFAALETACALEDPFPEGMGVVAAVDKLPGDEANSLLASDTTPYFKVALWPEPDDVFCAGFHDCAIVLRSRVLSVLKKDAAGTWTLLGKYDDAPTAPPRGQASLIRTGPGQQQMSEVSILCVQVPPDWVYVLAGGSWHAIRLRTTAPGTSPDTLFSAGQWWVAGYPGQHLLWHSEVVGYAEAIFPPSGKILQVDTSGGGSDTDASAEEDPVPPRIMWDTGGTDYCPNQVPVYDYTVWFGGGTSVTTTAIPGGWESRTGVAREQENEEDVLFDQAGVARFQMQDVNGIPWGRAPDGEPWPLSNTTLHSGGFAIVLSPYGEGDIAFFLQVRPITLECLSLKFPVLLANRAYDTLVLDDTYFMIEAEAALLEPDGKRIRITLNPAGSALAVADGFDWRTNYPVHWYRMVDGSPQILAAGWVGDDDGTDPRVPMPVADGIRLQTIEGRGILGRADSKWMYLPVLLPDANGDLIHTDVVAEVLRQKGIDADDANQVSIATDTGPVEVQALPTARPQAGHEEDNPAQPDWDKTALDYLTWVEQDWRGWLLYEHLDGLILAHPDLRIATQLDGATYFVACTLYRTATESVTASVGTAYFGDARVPHMKYRADVQQRAVRPRGNCVRITGQGSDGKPLHVLHRDPALSGGLFRTVSDPTYEGFMGEWVPQVIHARGAIDAESARWLAAMALYRMRLPRQTVTAEVVTPYLPIDWIPYAVDVGYVITLNGRGDYRITHMQVATMGNGWYRVRLTCEEMLVGSVASLVAGAWPGSGA